MLTEAEIRAAKPSEKPFKLFDGSGLYLLVNPNGSRWWRLKYRVAGREKLLSLGVYQDVPLKRAREKRDEARRMIADGIDPSAQRQAVKAAQRDSFEAIAREYFEVKRKALAVTRFDKRTKRFEDFVFPYAGHCRPARKRRTHSPIRSANAAGANGEAVDRRPVTPINRAPLVFRVLVILASL